MADPELGAGGGVGGGAIPGAVVGHDALNVDAAGGEPTERSAQEPDTTRRAFVVEDLDVGQPGGVVDGDVAVLPAHPAVAALASAGHPVPRRTEPPKLLDVDVDQLAGMAAAITVGRLGRLETAEAVQAQTHQDRPHRGDRHVQPCRDARRGHPQAAQPLDQRLNCTRRAARHPLGRRGPVNQAAVAGAPAGQPAIHRPLRHTLRRSDIRDLPVLRKDARYQQQTRRRNELGVTVKLHRDPPWG